MKKLSIVSTITPFDKNKKIDFVSLKNLLERQVRAGASGVYLASKIGEGDFLLLNEKISLYSFVRDLLGEEFPCYLSLSPAEINEVKDLQAPGLDKIHVVSSFDEKLFSNAVPFPFKTLVINIKSQEDLEFIRGGIFLKRALKFDLPILKNPKFYHVVRVGDLLTERSLSSQALQVAKGCFSSAANVDPDDWHLFALECLDNREIVSPGKLKKFYPYIFSEPKELTQKIKQALYQSGLCEPYTRL